MENVVPEINTWNVDKLKKHTGPHALFNIKTIHLRCASKDVGF